LKRSVRPVSPGFFTTVFSFDRDLLAPKSGELFPARALRSRDLVNVSVRLVIGGGNMENIKLCL
jgi:hypothetical protein